MPPTLIFGDIRSLDPFGITPILQKYGITRLDSAAVYAGGESERRLGEAKMSEHFIIDTKILSGRPSGGTLTPANIEDSSRKSLERLKVEKVNVLYVHAPDFETSVREQARGFQSVFEKGRFRELGLSNCPPEMVREWLDISKKEGWVNPTWYQGHYNLISRTFEEILFPMLREEGMHFTAYSPLAGGFLKGNFSRDGEAKGERFNNHAVTKMYRDWFDRPAMHTAFEKLQAISKETGLPTDELSLRWLVHHSALQDGDAFILGASKASQIEPSLINAQKGPLDEATAKKLTDIWDDELREAARDLVELA